MYSSFLRSLRDRSTLLNTVSKRLLLPLLLPSFPGTHSLGTRDQSLIPLAIFLPQARLQLVSKNIYIGTIVHSSLNIEVIIVPSDPLNIIIVGRGMFCEISFQTHIGVDIRDKRTRDWKNNYCTDGYTITEKLGGTVANC